MTDQPIFDQKISALSPEVVAEVKVQRILAIIRELVEHNRSIDDIEESIRGVVVHDCDKSGCHTTVEKVEGVVQWSDHLGAPMESITTQRAFRDTIKAEGLI